MDFGQALYLARFFAVKWCCLVFLQYLCNVSGRNPGTCTEAYRYLSLKIANLNNADRPINARWLYIILRYIAKRGFGLYLHGVWRCLKLVNR